MANYSGGAIVQSVSLQRDLLMAAKRVGPFSWVVQQALKAYLKDRQPETAELSTSISGERATKGDHR